MQVATSPIRAKPSITHTVDLFLIWLIIHNIKFMQLLSLHVHLLFLGTNFKWKKKKKKLMLTIEVVATSVVFSWWSFYKEHRVKQCPYRSKSYLPVSSWWPHSIYKMGTILRTLQRQQKTLHWEVSFTFLHHDMLYLTSAITLLHLVIFSSNLSLVYSSISLSIQLFILVSNLPVNEIPSQ